MFRFYYLNKMRFILTSLILNKHLFWCAFLYFQGNAIQQAIERKDFFWGLIVALIGFVFAKSLMMLVEVLHTFFTNFFENKEIHKQWQTQFPLRLFQDTENKDNLIYLFYFDYLPNLFSLECATIVNICSIISILSIVLCLVFYTQFYLGLISLTVISLLSFFSKNIGLKAIDSYQKQRNEEKAGLFQWIHQYFKSYREVSFNWQGQINQWSKIQYQHLYRSNKKIIVMHLIRDLFSQLLIEIPFVINTSMVIIGVYFQYLSITQLFIWIGLSQFVIQASNSYLEIKLNKIKKNNLYNKIDEILLDFSSRISNFRVRELSEYRSLGKNIINQTIKKDKLIEASDFLEIKLQDGTSNYLSLSPSLYHIKGKNGSGKTTLLHIILGYERFRTMANTKMLRNMFGKLSTRNIRVVEKDPVIFNTLDLFHHQILGPNSSKPMDWKKLLTTKVGSIFTHDVIDELRFLLREIELKFNSRSEKKFSSGEKVMISFLRVIHSWSPEVSLLIIDECTAFLDVQIKRLFMQCMKQLSQVVAIYLCSHEENLSIEKIDVS